MESFLTTNTAFKTVWIMITHGHAPDKGQEPLPLFSDFTRCLAPLTHGGKRTHPKAVSASGASLAFI
jgi:hypothetical protein